MWSSTHFSPHRSPPGLTSDAQSSSDHSGHSLPNTSSSSTDHSALDPAPSPRPFSEFNSANLPQRHAMPIEYHHQMNTTYDDDYELESALAARHQRFPFAHEETGIGTEHELEDEPSHHQPADGDGNELDEELDSLADASESEVAERARAVLGMDPDGRVLPLAAEDEHLLHSLWSRAGICDLRPGLSPAAARPIDPDSPQAPAWFRRLQTDVLVQPPSKPEEEEALVNAINQNLLAIVNNLASDQWLYPVPSAFLPSSTSLSTRTAVQGPESSEETYLQTDFNPRSHTSLSPSDPTEAPLLPPRQLWLGEDEDEGADSDVSLVDLLNASPARSDAQRSNVSARWSASAARRTHTRHGHGSALARQVSRLGMTE